MFEELVEFNLFEEIEVLEMLEDLLGLDVLLEKGE